jgi:hypothetical protein
MPPTESWVLDSLPLTSGSFTLMELNADPPRQRPDWITAADSEAAALIRQPLYENRTITMKLRVSPQPSMNTALDRLGALVDKLQAASATGGGIDLVWTPSGATRSCTFDVLAGEITGMPIALSGDGYSWILGSPIITISLTCHPYWHGTETLTSTASSSTPFVTLEISSVTGDVQALGRIIITDTATQSRRHVEWGLEGPLTYNASTSLLVDSDDMVTSGFGGSQATTSGAYDPNASGNNSVSCPLYSNAVAVCGVGNLSHVGTFRVKARINPAFATMEVRFSWRAGDGPMSANAWTTGVAAWCEVDLGTISIPTATVGTQRWTGQIEARSPGGLGGSLVIDYLTLVPCLDGYGKARATYSYSAGVMTGEDSFLSTTAGNALNARVAPLGGTWATSGDATDFVFADNFNVADSVESIVRSTSVAETSGRFAILGATSYTDSQIDVRSRIAAGSASGLEQSLILRWTDANNHLRMVVPDLNGGTVRIEQVVASVVTVLATTTWDRAFYSTSYRLRLIAFASGRVIGQIMSDGGSLIADMQTSATVIATGGTLQTGKPGLRDRSMGTLALTRYFTQISVSTPVPEPIVLYSGRNMQIRYDDVLRQDSTGTYSGRPPSYRGSRFLVPVGTSRVLVKARRNDIEVALDSNVTDALQIQIGWTPRGLAVPR